ncbi:hypothetical protein BAUCODRAFT_35157 [Baudoinia panamericana UAMH 10762]|uniref:t-SNARE coiled-coil homology domain-containing protein n=1 Tax=Baudoinia panamericana (strain UAMH 10762) TaxID=717646 RepID=M2MEY4_BAUPA|nr:uncharacterized protein BAUCODRAFT_35157 [Baudoinia panamericana UAMH 10762]EMC95166.1 hypothetical protein BAUCODRAFT_35157 [Baudoinia panamericana UAMH 10762]
MPFGFKKGDKGEETSSLSTQKASLFGKSKLSKSPAPSSANPYAVPPPSSDPYSQQSANPYASQNPANDVYAPRSQTSLSQPPASSFGSLTLNSEQSGPPPYGRNSPVPNRSEKSPVPTGGYGGGAPRFPSRNSYGQANGYGDSNPYGGQNGSAQSRYGAGGYGGLGRRMSQETMTTDAGREALFGDAAQRAQSAEQEESFAANEQSSDASYANADSQGAGGMPGNYGYGEERELTAEERENADIDSARLLIKETKQKTVASSSNAARIAAQTEETARNALIRLGQQGDHLHKTEEYLDAAEYQNRQATSKAKELKTLNRSFLLVHMDNPFRGKALDNEAAKRAGEARAHERETAVATSAAAYNSTMRHRGQATELRPEPGSSSQQTQRNYTDRAKYQFEADSDDDQMENDIEDNMNIIHQGVKNMKKIGIAMSQELESQNKLIDRISGKSDKVDDQIAMNRARLDRIKK